MPPLWRGLVAYLLLRGRSIQTYAQASICKYTHFTVDDGLPPVKAYGLLQDRTGCTWLATGVGLCYFDEYLFLAQVSWFKVASCLAALFLAGLVVYAVAARNQNKRLNRLVEIKARELNAKMKDLYEDYLTLTFVPTPTRLASSSICSLVTAIQPSVQLTMPWISVLPLPNP